MITIELSNNIDPELRELSDFLKKSKFEDARIILSRIKEKIDVNLINVPITVTKEGQPYIGEFGWTYGCLFNILLSKDMALDSTLEKNMPFFHWITSVGSLEAMKFLLDEGFNPNILDNEGYPALSYVIFSYAENIARDSQLNKINFLLNNGANPNIFGQDHLGMPDYQKSPIYLVLDNPPILKSILIHNSNRQDFQKDYSPFLKLAIDRFMSYCQYSEDCLKLLLSHSDISAVTECFSDFSNYFHRIQDGSKLIRTHKFFNIVITSFGFLEKSYKDFEKEIQTLKETKLSLSDYDVLSYDLLLHNYIGRIIDKIVGFGKHPIFENPDLRHHILSYVTKEDVCILLKVHNSSGSDEEPKAPDIELSGDVLEETGMSF